MGKKTMDIWGKATWLFAVTATLLPSGCGNHVSVGGGGSGGSGGSAGGAGGATTSSSTTDTVPTGTTSSTTTTTTTTMTTTTTTTTTVSGSFLALECVADADCGGGRCVRVSDDDPILGGGVAGGYCTLDCATDGDCPGAGSTCLKVDPNGAGECLLGCLFGDPSIMSVNDPLDPSKCHGREDLRCQELSDGSQVCLPSCGDDSQCAGRSCDLRRSVCVDAPPSGDVLGAACDPQAMMTTCAGVCIGITGGKSMCTSPCTMGGEVPNPLECGGDGICIYSPSGTGVGDLGYCARSCAQQDECQTPSFFCFDVGVADSGLCLDSDACVTDADCANLPNGACVATTLGKYCMSALYPLGTLTP